MLISGVFKVVGFEDKDTQQSERIIKVQNAMDSGMEARLFCPPYLRKTECDIKIGSTVWGIADTVSGQGCALFGLSCDYSYWVDADLTFKKSLTVKDDIKSQSGDVIATTVSLQNHIHTVTGSFTGTVGELPATGSVTGSTDKPT